MHSYIVRYILLGNFCVYMLCLCSILCENGSGDYDRENWMHETLAPLSDRAMIISSSYYDTSTFSFPRNYLVSCEDLRGVGSFDTTCLLKSHLHMNSDLYIYGTGNLEILPNVLMECPLESCSIILNMSGNVRVSQSAAVVASSVVISAANLTIEYYSSINATSLGGLPPSQTSGTPIGYDGAGGGHGGRGASCFKHNQTSFWGGDVYAWSTLSEPWSYGSRGGGISPELPLGGSGGGRVKLLIKEVLLVNGSVTAEGGYGGSTGGGGSGGSIFVHAIKLKGSGAISAAGGNGWGGGGGGRISLDCYSIQEDVKVTVHGLSLSHIYHMQKQNPSIVFRIDLSITPLESEDWISKHNWVSIHFEQERLWFDSGFSIGCPGNAGAAGTYFNADLLSLRVSNDNITTETETPLLDFSTTPLWSNVFVENCAKVLVPLLWTRVQVRGQISIYSGGSIVFGLSKFPVSEFELVAEELLMSDSIIKVFGALRVAVKMLLMWNSAIQIDGVGNTVVTSSVLEVRNLVVLRQNSVISSNTNLVMYGQGLLKLTGHGDAIIGHRLSLSLFYNITVGPGSLLQAPLDYDTSKSAVTKSLCESQLCPIDLITPPDDCHFNNSLSFSLQICRVEDLLVNGFIKGSVIHIHRARTVIVGSDGMITSSEFGCSEGIGKGSFSNGAGSGAGHGGRGGSGYFNGWVSYGGDEYGDADLPCEMGSGTLGPDHIFGHAFGGGVTVIGSMQWPLQVLDVYGSLKADGQSLDGSSRNHYGSVVGGIGGGSGGTILLFLQELRLHQSSSLTVTGGNGRPPGGGGGGGGRIHLHWSNIKIGEDYIPVASISGSINNSGGAGNNGGLHGGKGTVTGRECPKGLFGTFCKECPTGTYKDVHGSDANLCTPCSLDLLPKRANFIYVRGGVSQSYCPYRCISDKYRLPNCYTPLEELVYTFGGPWPFAILLSCILVIVALLLNSFRIKWVGYSSNSYSSANSIERHPHHHFPYLLSLSEVRGTRAEETQNHVHRMYFMGPNTFGEPWHLPYSPPNAIIEIVYEDAFNRFIDEINSVAAYQWWEGSVNSILSILAYPCAWTWKQWRRKHKVHRLQEYVKSEYDHSCLRSCRSRALYKGMKVGATSDLMVAYIDFFLGGDEKRLDMVSVIEKRYPMCVIFGGDGSYMSPYILHSDILLTNLIGQHVPESVWNRLVDGFNAQLRTVRHGYIRSGLIPVIDWVNSHANPQLEFHGVKIELGWFQATASGYYQLGILVALGDYYLHDRGRELDIRDESFRNGAACDKKSSTQLEQSWTSQSLTIKRITGGVNGGIINAATLISLEYKKDFLFPLSLLLHNTRPLGHRDKLQLLIITVLLADLSITILMLIQFYWISLGAFLLVLLIFPLSIISPFPAGLNALFSKEPRRASLARVYALWNATSLSNIVVAFICGVAYYGFSSNQPPEEANKWNSRRDDDKWWLLPTILLLVKSLQARIVDRHIANLEVEDLSLFSPDLDAFWGHESG